MTVYWWAMRSNHLIYPIQGFCLTNIKLNRPLATVYCARHDLLISRMHNFSYLWNMPATKPIDVNNVTLNVPRWFFWEYVYDRIDWHKERVAIIQRVLERGTTREYDELVKFYGRRKIINALKNKINFLSDQTIQEVSAYFNIDTKELRCYTRKQSNRGHWI